MKGRCHASAMQACAWFGVGNPRCRVAGRGPHLQQPRAALRRSAVAVRCAAPPAEAPKNRRQRRREAGISREYDPSLHLDDVPTRGALRAASASVRPARTERLSKVLAQAGIASRRASEDVIASGRVKVNGEVVWDQQLVDLRRDKLTIDGKQILTAVPHHYFAVNKPKGYTCANVSSKAPEQPSRLVVDLLADWAKGRQPTQPRKLPPRLFTVGRLDVASTGLIFVTNDGEWAQKVQHPSHGLSKEYVVTCSTAASQRHLQAIADGTAVDGVHVTPVAVAPVHDSGPAKNHRIRVVVAEGRNREVRTLVAATGLVVTALKRVRIGGYRLPRGLGIGQVVPLQPWEVRRVVDSGAQSLPAVSPYI